MEDLETLRRAIKYARLAARLAEVTGVYAHGTPEEIANQLEQVYRSRFLTAFNGKLAKAVGA